MFGLLRTYAFQFCNLLCFSKFALYKYAYFECEFMHECILTRQDISKKLKRRYYVHFTIPLYNLPKIIFSFVLQDKDLGAKIINEFSAFKQRLDETYNKAGDAKSYCSDIFKNIETMTSSTDENSLKRQINSVSPGTVGI